MIPPKMITLGIAVILAGLIVFTWLWGLAGAILWFVIIAGLVRLVQQLPEAMYDQIRAIPRIERTVIEAAKRLARDNRAAEGAARLLAAVDEAPRDATLREAYAEFLWDKLKDGRSALRQFQILLADESVRIQSRAAHRSADILIDGGRESEAAEQLKTFAESAPGTKEGSQAWSRARKISA